MVCRMHFGMNTAQCKGHPIKNVSLSSEHNGKPQHFAVYSHHFTWYCLNVRQLEIKFPLMGRI